MSSILKNEVIILDDMMYAIVHLKLTKHEDYSNEDVSPFLIVNSLVNTIYHLEMSDIDYLYNYE